MGATLAHQDAILKDLYGDGRPAEIAYEKEPLLGLLPKETTFTGRKIVTPIAFANNQGVSADFTKGKTVLGYTRYDAWETQPVEYFGFVRFSRSFLKQVKKGEGAFVDGMKTEMDGLVDSLSSEIGFQLYGDGTANRGQISSGSNTGTTTITLADITKISNFEIDIRLFSDPSADGTGLTRNIDHYVIITKVNRSAGTLTASTNWNAVGPPGIGSCAASDYLYRFGDVGTGLHGLGLWLPTSAPTTTLQGVDRSVDPERLGGVRQGALGKTVEEALVDMAAEIGIIGHSQPDICMLNYRRWTQLEKELMSRGVRYVDMKSDKTSIGYKAITVNGPKGEIKVLSSPFCPYCRGYMLQLDTWKLVSCGEMPELFTEDGNTILRLESSNHYEARMGWLGQLTCNAPGKNGVILFDVAA